MFLVCHNQHHFHHRHPHLFKWKLHWIEYVAAFLVAHLCDFQKVQSRSSTATLLQPPPVSLSAQRFVLYKQKIKWLTKDATLWKASFFPLGETQINKDYYAAIIHLFYRRNTHKTRKRCFKKIVFFSLLTLFSVCDLFLLTCLLRFALFCFFNSSSLSKEVL